MPVLCTEKRTTEENIKNLGIVCAPKKKISRMKAAAIGGDEAFKADFKFGILRIYAVHKYNPLIAVSIIWAPSNESTIRTSSYVPSSNANNLALAYAFDPYTAHCDRWSSDQDRASWMKPTDRLSYLVCFPWKHSCLRHLHSPRLAWVGTVTDYKKPLSARCK